MTTKELIAALGSGTEANRQDIWRKGNMIVLGGPGEVIMTGDLHNSVVNFEKLIRYAQLEKYPHRHLMVHELLHGSDALNGKCNSYELVGRAAEMKACFPDQFHYLLGNHAMAQVTRDEILKGGQPMIRALNSGLFAAFPEKASLILEALDEFLLSLPIAARTGNGIWMSHSLPGKRNAARFDDDIFDRLLTRDDFKNDQSLRSLTWDRSHSVAGLAMLGERWGVEMFIIGHQPQSEGYERPQNQLAILASDHSKGCFLPFDLGEKYGPDDLFGRIRPLAAIA